MSDSDPLSSTVSELLLLALPSTPIEHGDFGVLGVCGSDCTRRKKRTEINLDGGNMKRNRHAVQSHYTRRGKKKKRLCALPAGIPECTKDALDLRQGFKSPTT